MTEKVEKASTDLEELMDAESQHIMVVEGSGDLQPCTVIVDPTMEDMNVPISPEEAKMEIPKPAKSVKQLVEEKGNNVTLSEDNRTLMVKGLMSFSNAGKKAMKDYKPSPEDLDLINKEHSNMDLSRR